MISAIKMIFAAIIRNHLGTVESLSVRVSTMIEVSWKVVAASGVVKTEGDFGFPQSNKWVPHDYSMTLIVST